MDTIKSAAGYVSQSFQGASSEASKEGNKQVAKSDEADVSTRLGAAKDAVGDKLDQSSHEAEAEVDKQKAKN